jgi:hypothetical protein
MRDGNVINVFSTINAVILIYRQKQRPDVPVGDEIYSPKKHLRWQDKRQQLRQSIDHTESKET